jgi:pimeloyl-ACP methyl ester carboxylesterase
MPFFSHDGFELSYLDRGQGEPILLIHGFASSILVNWVNPGWVKTLEDAGYRVIAFDHRGHGLSSKSYDEADYAPEKMASDAVALLNELGIYRAHVFGFSMGARVAAFMGLEYPERAATLIFGGLGIGLVEGVGEWDPIGDALLADDPAKITHPRGKMFRAFADQTKSDRRALAACIRPSRRELTPAQVRQIHQPVLVAVGTKDDIGGAAAPLAKLLPAGEAFDIEGRDHMLSVGDRTFKARALKFLQEHPI